MSRQQINQITPPQETDDNLEDYSSTLQRALEELFEESHEHSIRTTVPTTEEGQVGNIFLVDINGTTSIFAKFPSPLNWRSVTVS